MTTESSTSIETASKPESGTGKFPVPEWIVPIEIVRVTDAKIESLLKEPEGGLDTEKQHQVLVVDFCTVVNGKDSAWNDIHPTRMALVRLGKILRQEQPARFPDEASFKEFLTQEFLANSMRAVGNTPGVHARDISQRVFDAGKRDPKAVTDQQTVSASSAIHDIQS